MCLRYKYADICVNELIKYALIAAENVHLFTISHEVKTRNQFYNESRYEFDAISYTNADMNLHAKYENDCLKFMRITLRYQIID